MTRLHGLSVRARSIRADLSAESTWECREKVEKEVSKLRLRRFMSGHLRDGEPAIGLDEIFHASELEGRGKAMDLDQRIDGISME